MEVLRRFGLHDDLLIDDHIERLPGERLSPMIDHHADLTSNAMTLCHEVSFEGERVKVLPKSEAERSVNVIKDTDDGARQLFFDESVLASGVHFSRSVISPDPRHQFATYFISKFRITVVIAARASTYNVNTDENGLDGQ